MLHRDIEKHVEAIRAAKLSELTLLFESKLKEALHGPVEALLSEVSNETWPAIRKFLRHETEKAVSEYSAALAGFDMDEQTKDVMLSRLELYARAVVEEKAKEHSSRVLDGMKHRFTRLFTLDSNSKERDWTGKEDIQAICDTARISSLKLLSVLAAIRLDDEADNIENTLVLGLMDYNEAYCVPLASSSWQQVPASKTLITPAQCSSLWSQFLSETERMVTQRFKIHALKAESKAETKKVVAIFVMAMLFCFVLFGVVVLIKKKLKKT